MSGNLGGSARDVTAPERVVENQLRKMPRSKTDWLLVCNETFRVTVSVSFDAGSRVEQTLAPLPV